MFSKLSDFFANRLWNIRLSDLPFLRAVWIRICRIVILTFRFFFKNRCTLHAASLTYYTLLAIVPLLALVFGIAKGYGYDRILKERLMAAMEGHETVAEKVIGFADSAIQNASGGLVAGVGVLLLIWAAVKLFSEIEGSFNGIWGVKRGRSWARKFSDYLTLLVIYPFLIIMLATSGAFVMTRLESIAGCLPYPEAWHNIVTLCAKGVHLLVAWFIFFFIYIFAPNTKVRFRAALIAGILIGSCHIGLQYVYIIAQSKLTSYNAIYGSFAALPLFLIWLNIGWVITIFGAQLSFAIQNVNVYEMEPASGKLPVSDSYRWICALRITRVAVLAFEKREKPLSSMELSKRLEIPIRTTRRVIYELCEAGILSALMSEKGELDLYQPACPAENLTPLFILRQMALSGASAAVPEEIPDFTAILNLVWANSGDAALTTPVGKIV